VKSWTSLSGLEKAEAGFLQERPDVIADEDRTNLDDPGQNMPNPLPPQHKDSPQMTVPMIEVASGDLVGPALDWAVAVVRYGADKVVRSGDEFSGARWRVRELDEDGDLTLVGNVWSLDITNHALQTRRYEPSQNGLQCMELIDRYLIDFTVERRGQIFAIACKEDGTARSDAQANGSFGPNHMIAACRAIVLVEMGEKVMVPAELVAAA
jgi:hypothetical protein